MQNIKYLFHPTGRCNQVPSNFSAAVKQTSGIPEQASTHRQKRIEKKV